jgi:hypothetical protein
MGEENRPDTETAAVLRRYRYAAPVRSKTDVVVYTANIASYDQVREPAVDGRFVLFTDGEPVKGWEVHRIEGGYDARKQARMLKVLSHTLSDAEVTIWHDANVQLLVPAVEVVKAWLDGMDVATFRHPVRDCIYAEAGVCKWKGKDSPAVIETVLGNYQVEGFPEHYGLAETTVVVRRNNARVTEFNNLWWSAMVRGSLRDQLSFDYVRWLMEGRIEVNEVPGGPGWAKRKHPFFVGWGHGGKDLTGAATQHLSGREDLSGQGG